MTVRRGGPLTPPFHIGCSGWQYKHWRGDFYPAALPARRWFEYYAARFDTVEINSTFYRLPSAATFGQWREQAPPGFVYSLKASRFLTHMRKLQTPEEPLRRFFIRARRLGRCLGPTLFQLPPRWPLNLERLTVFLDALPRTARHVVEFREPTWYDERVYDLLRRHRVALCVHDMAGSAVGKIAVGPFVYVRFHGAGSRYGGRYDDRHLGRWADWMAERVGEGLQVFGYFNNDIGGHAPRDAVRLRDKLGRIIDGQVAPFSGIQ